MPLMPLDIPFLVGVVMAMLVVLIPVTGFTARFALRPIVDAIARAREGEGNRQAVQLLERRLALVEQQLQSMEGTVERLSEESEFHRKLADPSTAGPLPSMRQT